MVSGLSFRREPVRNGRGTPLVVDESRQEDREEESVVAHDRGERARGKESTPRGDEGGKDERESSDQKLSREPPQMTVVSTE